MRNLKQLLLKSFILSAVFFFMSCSSDDGNNNSNIVEVVEDEEELSELMIYLRDKWYMTAYYNGNGEFQYMTDCMVSERIFLANGVLKFKDYCQWEDYAYSDYTLIDNLLTLSPSNSYYRQFHRIIIEDENTMRLYNDERYDPNDDAGYILYVRAE